MEKIDVDSVTQVVVVFEEAGEIALPQPVPATERYHGAKVQYGTRAHYLPEYDTLVVEHAASGAITSALTSRKTAHIVESHGAAVRMAVTLADAWAAEVKAAVTGPTERDAGAA